MKKTIIPIIFNLLLIPIVSAFISPAKSYSRGELNNAILGNNIFFGALFILVVS